MKYVYHAGLVIRMSVYPVGFRWCGSRWQGYYKCAMCGWAPHRVSRVWWAPWRKKCPDTICQLWHIPTGIDGLEFP